MTYFDFLQRILNVVMMYFKTVVTSGGQTLR